MNGGRPAGVAIGLMVLASVLASCGTAQATPEPIMTPAGTSQPSGSATQAATISPTPAPLVETPTPAPPTATSAPPTATSAPPTATRRPSPTPEPEPTPALNKTARFANFAIDYASPVPVGEYDPAIWLTYGCDRIDVAVVKCPPFWFYTIRFRALQGKSPAVIDLVRVRLYDSNGKEWYPSGGKDFVAIEDVIDFKSGGTDLYMGRVENPLLGDFHGARVELEFKHNGSSAVAKISFILGK